MVAEGGESQAKTGNAGGGALVLRKESRQKEDAKIALLLRANPHLKSKPRKTDIQTKEKRMERAKQLTFSSLSEERKVTDAIRRGVEWIDRAR